MALLAPLRAARRRYAYYLRSVWTILRGFRRPLRALAILAGAPAKTPIEVALRNGLVFSVPTPIDVWVVKEVCLDAEYEQDGITIGPDWTILDIGAGIGEFAVVAARKSSRGHVYAYEPAPAMLRLLGRNVVQNGVRNVTAFPLAVSDAPGQVMLDTSSGVHVLNRTVPLREAAGAATVVPSTTLDAIFTTLDLARCDLLKLDCEGVEFALLFAAAPETVARIDRIALEYHDQSAEENHERLSGWLRRRGFMVRRRQNPVHPSTGHLYAIRPGLS